MSIMVALILVVILLIVTIICFDNCHELLGSIIGLLTVLLFITACLTVAVGKETIYDPKTKEFVIENLYYNEDGYLTQLIDDKGNAHRIHAYDVVSMAENDKVSYVETTEKVVAKFLFIYYNTDRVVREAKLPKDAYYAYKYGKNANIISVEQCP